MRRNALGIVILLWLLLGLVNFAVITNYLASIMPNNLLLASFYLDISFAISAAIIVGLIVWWQRKHGETLRDLGWRRPTTITAIVIGIIYGILWILLSYAREPHPVQSFLAFGEELAMRGFFMEQLRRGGIPTWLQIITCAIFMGGYHGTIGLHHSLLYGLSSMVLFGIIAVIFVIGKRSLTPGTIAHAMVHFFGDPVLTLGILYGAIMLGVLH